MVLSPVNHPSKPHSIYVQNMQKLAFSIPVQNPVLSYSLNSHKNTSKSQTVFLLLHRGCMPSHFPVQYSGHKNSFNSVHFSGHDSISYIKCCPFSVAFSCPFFEAYSCPVFVAYPCPFFGYALRLFSMACSSSGTKYFGIIQKKPAKISFLSS